MQIKILEVQDVLLISSRGCSPHQRRKYIMNVCFCLPVVRPNLMSSGLPVPIALTRQTRAFDKLGLRKLSEKRFLIVKIHASRVNGHMDQVNVWKQTAGLIKALAVSSVLCLTCLA